MITHAKCSNNLGQLELRALLCDFGFTKDTGKDEIVDSSLTNGGSARWKAWELVNSQRFYKEYGVSYDDRIALLPKADVWSWGMTTLVKRSVKFIGIMGLMRSERWVGGFYEQKTLLPPTR
jgi:hypothetical protein